MKRARSARRERERADDRASPTQHEDSPELAAEPTARGGLIRAAWWLLLVVALGVSLFARVRLLEIPLERDEGEYAYAGQLMLQGVAPYDQAYNMKLPGTYAAYALLMAIFGQTTAGVHLGLLVVNLATVALVFCVAKQLLDTAAAIAAAASYAMLSVSPAVLGSAGHATHFVVLPVLGALLLLLRAGAVGRLAVFAAGMLLGLAVLMKQPGVFFVPFGAALLVHRDWRDGRGWRVIALRLSLFAAGVALPLAATGLLLWYAGVFEKFWFWTVTYAREYGRLIPLSVAGELFLRSFKGVIASAWMLWFLGALGLVACISSRALRRNAVVLVGFLVFSALAVTPGFYFRQHYFIVVLPAVCLLVGAVVAWCTNTQRKTVSIAAWCGVAAALLAAVYADRAFLFQLDPIAASRSVYGTNPFPEAERVAAFLRERSTPEDKIVVMGSEPQIYFHAQRRSATGFIYIYSLMEVHRLAREMHEQMIAEVEAANPKYLVLVAIEASWGADARSETLIYEWMLDYRQRHFRLVGFADILSTTPTEYHLPAAPGSRPTSPLSIMIYERI